MDMGRGLGKIQRGVLEVLKTKSPSHGLHESVNGTWMVVEGWYDVLSVAHMVIRGIDCFEGGIKGGIDYRKLTESELQLVWRAIRGLGKRKHIEARTFPILWVNRANFGKQGGASRVKAIRLAQPTSGVN